MASLVDRIDARWPGATDQVQSAAMNRSMPLLRWVARHDAAAGLLNRVFTPFNPLDPRRYADPYPLYEVLRSHGPVVHHRRVGMYLVTGHDEVEQVLRARTSVDRSRMIRRISPYTQMDQRVIDLISNMLLMSDPPDHTRLRKLVSRAFTPRSVARLEPEVERVAKELLDEVSGESSFDVMSTFASQLPIYMIGELLGVPRETWPRLKHLSDIIAKLVDPMVGFDPRAMESAVAEVTGIFRTEFAERRRRSRDDLLSALVEADTDGDRLSDDELVGMCILLMVAGHETTTGLIGNTIVALDTFRDERRRLIDRPDLIEGAVEEFLRFDSPVQTTDRIAIDEFTVGGVTIPAGSVVGVMLGAANRDPRRHDDPASLRIDRPDPRPLSFGHGIHHCVGAALARLETQVAVTAFLQRFPDHEVMHDDLEWKRSVTLRGPQVLPVRS